MYLKHAHLKNLLKLQIRSLKKKKIFTLLQEIKGCTLYNNVITLKTFFRILVMMYFYSKNGRHFPTFSTPSSKLDVNPAFSPLHFHGNSILRTSKSRM